MIRCGALPSLPAAPIPLRAIALARQGAQAIAGQAGAGQAGAMQATKRERRPDRPSPAFGQRRGARCGARHVVRKAAPPGPLRRSIPLAEATAAAGRLAAMWLPWRMVLAGAPVAGT